MNILLMGVGYFPFLTAGEKNYFYKMLPIIREKHGVAVLSLNDYDKDYLEQATPSEPIPVYCARRPFHSNYEKYFYKRENFLGYHHLHKPPQEIVEKFISILFLLPRIRKIIQDNKIHVIHFMDNFGPAMPLVRFANPGIRVTYSAANYQPRGSIQTYNRYLKYSLNYLHGAGVYSRDYLNILKKIGVRIPLFFTPWGVNTQVQRPDPAKLLQIRQSLGIAPDKVFLLWSGFIQQIKERDFYRSIKAAKEIHQQRPETQFLFAFKPEFYQPEYARFASEGICVTGNLKNFREVLAAADFFFSPVGDQDSTVSPPLTWLEAMAYGVPIITTNVGGVPEIVKHNETGFVAQSYEELLSVTEEALALEDNKLISRNARRLIQNSYDIRKSAEGYKRMWEVILK